MTAVVCWLLTAYWFVLIVRIVASWFPAPTSPAGEQFMGLLWALTEPVLAPLRSVFPPVRAGGLALDLSPIAVFILIAILRGVIC